MKLFSGAILLGCALSYINALSCKDESGDNVSSWSILKLPRGTEYYYYDINNELSLSPHSLNDTMVGALAHTMKQLWTNDINYKLYNDEPPFQEEYNFTVGHSKGVWMWDINSAVLVTHSIPKFPVGPKTDSEYMGLLENAWDYGQSMSCIEISLSSLEQIFSTLAAEVPLVYEESCNTAGLCTNDIQKDTIQELNATISCSTELIDNKYVMFVKTSENEIDIWSDCIAEYFGTEMRVESWVHGELEGSYCPPDVNFRTLDIKSVNFGDGNSFVEYDDHSKWGLGVSPLVCYGDMNRVTTQKTRGGSTYCWKDATLWNNMNAIINSTSTC